MASQDNDDLKVIGAGFGRTGTVSLQTALERLYGRPCYHMHIARTIPADIDFWIRACQEDPSDDEWRHFFAKYASAVDIPAAAFYQRLIEVFPNAKIILTTRSNTDAWHASFMNCVVPYLDNLNSISSRLLSLFSPTGRSREFHDYLVKRFYGENVNLADKKAMVSLYHAHVEAVKRSVPPERLLLFEAKDGWAPLCEFLKMPVPEEPYPHANSRAVYDKGETQGQKIIRRFGFLFVIGAVVAIGAVLSKRMNWSR